MIRFPYEREELEDRPTIEPLRLPLPKKKGRIYRAVRRVRAALGIFWITFGGGR